MSKVMESLGPGLVISILGMIIRPALPWLKEQAAKSETPLDNWAIEFLEMAFGVKGE